MRKIAAVLCGVLVILTMLGPIPIAAQADIKVEVDGTEITFDVAPQMTDDRILVPLRKIFEEIGALVKWDEKSQTVQARKNKKTVTLTVGSTEMIVDKGELDSEGTPVTETVYLDVPVQITEQRTLVPLRALVESFGLDAEWNSDAQKVIVTSKKNTDDAWKENTGSINLTNLTYTGEGIEITDGKILITAGGDYTLSGVLADGNITVSTEERVKLRLSGASVTSAEGPCIFVENADKAYITITENTENSLTAKQSENGAIYAKDNLEIKGNGTLNITADNGHGIKASDNLTVENGTVTINAASDGIHVNDTFKMSGGTLCITALGDGIDSESIAVVSGGTLNIQTNGVPIAENQNTDTERNNPGGMFEQKTGVTFEKSSKGIKADWMLCISGGDITVNAASHAIHCAGEIEITGGKLVLKSEYEKGISAHGNLTVSNSDTVIDVEKSTEGLESKSTLTIYDGTVRIVASDDGINATGGRSGEMQGGMPMGGGMTPPNMPQGRLDGMENRGDMPNQNQMQPFANDHVAPPALPEGETAFPNDFATEGKAPPEFEEHGRRNENREYANNTNLEDCLVIHGGNIEIFAEDDCVDSNGNLTINGGVLKAVKVNGSFTGPNSVLDADGTVTVGAGATLVLAGNGGTEGGLTVLQNTITVYGAQTHEAGENIAVTDADGNLLVSYTPNGSYRAVLITVPSFETGKTYTVSLGAETQQITVSEQNTSIGTPQSGRTGFMQFK